MINELNQNLPQHIPCTTDTVGVGSPDVKPMVWFLSGRLLPNQPIRHMAIQPIPFQVGRRTNLALSLPNKSVSSVHAEILIDGGSLILRDLGSTNGTFVNGERVLDTVVLKEDDIIQFAEVAFRVLRQSFSLNTRTDCQDVYDQAMALVQFDRLMSEQAVIPYYQPIVDFKSEQIIGHEVLGRSRIAGLETPSAMFSAAVKLNLETKLSEMFRWKAIQQTMSFAHPPHLFLNTHPIELRGPRLMESIKEIRELNPRQKLTLEIHEAAVTNPSAMAELGSELRSLGIGLAFDDFGAGQIRLLELSEVHPDYLKFDMSLIRSIHLASNDHMQMVATLVRMVRDMGVMSLAEGVECKEEAEACQALGFELVQGFYFGKPAPLAAESHEVHQADCAVRV